MPAWVLLFRGMNVGGAGRIAMVDLSSALSDAGFETPRTYLQSGNAVAGYPETDATIVARDAAHAVAARIGFQTTVVALDAAGLAAALAAVTPHANDPVDANVHVSFLTADAAPSAPEALQRLCHPAEHVAIHGRFVVLHAPNGIGRSKVASAIERATGVAATSRNRRTIRALAAMLSDLAVDLANRSGTP